jgi:Uma2 family endonuclease
MSTGTLSTAALPSVSLPHSKRWTVEEFHRICGELIYRNHQFILVEGEILEMPIPNPPHDASLGLTLEALRTVFPAANYWVRPQMPLVLGLSTDPMPDLAVVAGSPRAYSTLHPQTAVLVVEISESTLAYDLREKANLYAAGGITDYWVVDLPHSLLHVMRQPARDNSQRFGACYTAKQSLNASQNVSPLAAPESNVAVSALLLRGG